MNQYKQQAGLQKVAEAKYCFRLSEPVVTGGSRGRIRSASGYQ